MVNKTAKTYIKSVQIVEPCSNKRIYAGNSVNGIDSCLQECHLF